MRKIHGLLGFLEWIVGLVAHNVVCYLNTYRFHGCRGRAGFSFIATECSGLEGDEVWWIAGKGNVSGKFSLKHLAD